MSQIFVSKFALKQTVHSKIPVDGRTQHIITGIRFISEIVTDQITMQDHVVNRCSYGVNLGHITYYEDLFFAEKSKEVVISEGNSDQPIQNISIK